MSEAHARHAAVADAGEPPSRYHQYSWLESLTTAFVDGDPSYLFLLFGSYIQFPLEILMACHGIGFLLMAWYGDLLIGCLGNESLVATSTVGMAALGSLFIQGIGYGVAEILRTIISARVAPLKVRYNEVVIMLVKNCFLILMTFYLRKVVSGIPYVDLVDGALYALVVSAIHEFAFGTPYFKKMVSYGALYSITYSMCYESILGSSGYQSIFSYGVLCAMAISTVQEVIAVMPWTARAVTVFFQRITSTITGVITVIQHKPDAAMRFAGYAGLIFVGFLTSGAYASSVGVIVDLVPPLVVTGITLLGALEQALMYEYSYRVTYFVYQLVRGIWYKQSN